MNDIFQHTGAHHLLEGRHSANEDRILKKLFGLIGAERTDNNITYRTVRNANLI